MEVEYLFDALINLVSVGGIFAFPLGVIGVTKAIGLGISSGYINDNGFH